MTDKTVTPAPATSPKAVPAPARSLEVNPAQTQPAPAIAPATKV